jgi:translation initiation factor 5A|uniref:Eukaryotic translation initiation factor 5A n=1 Tax=Eutreptiella gymnastica TaxID=73025 RepID=A0A6T2ATX7_9EUGL|mmetsp:Transcript_93058/g.156291  ORF Transcript_93058/g.156291 Transcript_93058/m.156291 type:complete len:160 (-) Transcript_93058:528-1007(-)|eukprot:CAMPEP_0174282908 /NCGR_PEP_ID=MMETSP0809-20121228/3485_1 /TAXON_ID=73025 ORGANISM="Eutreptiella gymnastica-like, Strain CCMP1594" /NCGR_SAMPLE_ID=MMETSP0809 /ASSEMBLY_ACC=CAM_ASM_000658 /LENGTH=159 /DNA_ID=CAMNT_0015377431 /DNA_START=35 /DNA_END=514 /DNA_ORIENTATION=+
MADEDTGEYHVAESGASKTYPMQCGALKKNGYVCIKGRPVKIVDYSTSKTGKHGHAKAHIIGIDIFTQKKLEELCPTTHNMDVPNVTRTEYQLMDIDPDSGYVSLMTDDGGEKSDLTLPNGEVGDQVKKLFDADKTVIVSVISAMGEEAIVGCKVDGGD